MITVLLMHLCVAAGPHPCDSTEVWAVESWEGPTAPVRCEEQRRDLTRALTPKNRLTTRFECESESTEVAAHPEPASWRF